MTRAHVYSAITCVVVAIAPQLAAQGASRAPSGFVASLGLGAGSAQLSCATCSGNEASVSGLLRIGRALTSNVTLGGEVSAWRKNFSSTSGSATTTLVFANVIAQWFPAAASGFFVKVGGGVSSIRSDVTLAGFGDAKLDDLAPGFVAGVGYDLALTSSVLLTPYADYNYGAQGAAHASPIASTLLSGRLLQAGLAISVR